MWKWIKLIKPIQQILNINFKVILSTDENIFSMNFDTIYKTFTCKYSAVIYTL